MCTALWGFLLLALVAATPALAQEEEQVGMWTQVNTLEGGVITTLVKFNADGTATQETSGEGDLDAMLAALSDEDGGDSGNLQFELGEGTFLFVLNGT